MDYLLVDRGADASGEAAVTLEGGRGAMQTDVALNNLVNLPGGDARANHSPSTTKGRLGHCPGGLHLLDLFGSLDVNHLVRRALTSA